MNKLLMMSAAILVVIASSRPTSATIVSGAVTGGSAFAAGNSTFIKLTVPLNNPFGPPNSVGNNTFENRNLYGFDEDQNITLLADLAVDEGSSPIPAGTVVASHYIFFDPLNPQSLIGSVTFDSKVLGIMTSLAKLSASDFLANTGVNYLNPNARGLESGDSVTISGEFTIAWNTTASNPGDYVRVLTAVSPAAAVPEPSTIATALAGLAFAGVVQSRRRKIA